MDGLFRPACLTIPTRLTDVLSWHGHIPLAFALIDRLRPRTFVELGVHKGDSYCAFCQAVRVTGSATRCFGVDVWKGDVHAGEYDGARVLNDLREFHDGPYSEFSTLLPMTFDEAVHRFPNGSIDLLHVDGLHTYDAVRHDFETYLPKLSRRAVVLFHDTNVRNVSTFEVWRYWEEVRSRYPSIEFEHSHGLGVLAVGTEAAGLLPELFGGNQESRNAALDLFTQLGAWTEELGRSRFDVHRLTGEVEWLHHERRHLRTCVEHGHTVQAQLTNAIVGMQQSMSWRLGTVLTGPVRAFRRPRATSTKCN